MGTLIKNYLIATENITAVIHRKIRNELEIFWNKIKIYDIDFIQAIKQNLTCKRQPINQDHSPIQCRSCVVPDELPILDWHGRSINHFFGSKKERMTTKIIEGVFGLIMLSLLAACKRNQPLTVDPNLTAVVIQREHCTNVQVTEFAVLNLDALETGPSIGDTLTIDGLFYSNVIKVRGLDNGLETIGTKVYLEYTGTSPSRLLPPSCSVTNPRTYFLKELYISYQAETK